MKLCCVIHAKRCSHPISPTCTFTRLQNSFSMGSFLRPVPEGCTVCKMVIDLIDNTPFTTNRLTATLHLPLDKLHSRFVKSGEPTIVTSETIPPREPYNIPQSRFSTSGEPIIVNTDGMTPLQELHASKKRPTSPISSEFHSRMISSARSHSFLIKSCILEKWKITR